MTSTHIIVIIVIIKINKNKQISKQTNKKIKKQTNKSTKQSKTKPCLVVTKTTWPQRSTLFLIRKKRLQRTYPWYKNYLLPTHCAIAGAKKRHQRIRRWYKKHLLSRYCTNFGMKKHLQRTCRGLLIYVRARLFYFVLFRFLFFFFFLLGSGLHFRLMLFPIYAPTFFIHTIFG